MVTTFICPCGGGIKLPDPEPEGSYDRICPECGAIWQFLNFPAAILLERKESTERFQVMLHYSEHDGKNYISITLEDRQKKRCSIVYRREI